MCISQHRESVLLLHCVLPMAERSGSADVYRQSGMHCHQLFVKSSLLCAIFGRVLNRITRLCCQLPIILDKIKTLSASKARSLKVDTSASLSGTLPLLSTEYMKKA